MSKLILSDKQLQRLNSEQLKRLGEIIVQNNEGASLTMEKSNSRYVNAPVPVVHFTGKLKVSIEQIRAAGCNVALTEIARLAEFSHYRNGELIVTSKEISDPK